ncbi:hypothetical protein PPERSA_00912 [Pseudocohnilembus persalinus]|uniref:Kinesin light chain n=1 Tax=Pseudocohnilembus persalinus TaxID=266149 RepID=A0A0V0QET3_PSEPJ|nr:hypothetical protein PPERSA_00912 [Pseudocohnilembus persalinus]|eukprot:KRX00685.1 hypothetical protein PPERSA_00912 [Pseudocohnilembus persalinus]
MLNLANLYIQQGMFHKALDYLNLVLSYRVGEHFMELRGEDNMEYDENNQIKFENYHLDEIEQIKNNKIPLCLIPMSKCYRELKEYEKSIKLSKRALELLRTFYKENNVLIATVHNNMGLTYKVMKGYNKAEESYLKALEIRKSILNEEHPDIIATKHNLGELYLAMDQPEKAQEYLFSNVDTMKKQLSKEQLSQQ